MSISIMTVLACTIASSSPGESSKECINVTHTERIEFKSDLQCRRAIPQKYNALGAFYLTIPVRTYLEVRCDEAQNI